MRYPGRKNVRKTLINMGRHLVYSEGTKTEMNYVNNIKSLLEMDEKHVNELIPVKYRRTEHTVDLIKRVENDIKNRRKKGETITGVWIFFDKDNYHDFDEACRLIEGKNCRRNYDGEMADECGTVWHNCWSIQCFELWCYLHFADLNVPIDRRQYIDKINDFVKAKGMKYQKNIENLFDWLLKAGGNVDNAIKLAKKKDNKSLPKQDPSTGVYLFVEFFKAYFKK